MLKVERGKNFVKVSLGRLDIVVDVVDDTTDVSYYYDKKLKVSKIVYDMTLAKFVKHYLKRIRNYKDFAILLSVVENWEE